MIAALLTKITVPQNEVALSYHSVSGLYFQADNILRRLVQSDLYYPGYLGVLNFGIKIADNTGSTVDTSIRLQT